MSCRVTLSARRRQSCDRVRDFDWAEIAGLLHRSRADPSIRARIGSPRAGWPLTRGAPGWRTQSRRSSRAPSALVHLPSSLVQKAGGVRDVLNGIVRNVLACSRLGKTTTSTLGEPRVRMSNGSARADWGLSLEERPAEELIHGDGRRGRHGSCAFHSTPVRRLGTVRDVLDPSGGLAAVTDPGATAPQRSAALQFGAIGAVR
jgi:hypothetical protein